MFSPLSKCLILKLKSKLPSTINQSAQVTLAGPLLSKIYSLSKTVDQALTQDQQLQSIQHGKVTLSIPLSNTYWQEEKCSNMRLIMNSYLQFQHLRPTDQFQLMKLRTKLLFSVTNLTLKIFKLHILEILKFITKRIIFGLKSVNN